MPKADRSYVNQILQIQSGAVELVAVAVLLAFGLGMAASALPSAIGIDGKTAVLAGLMLCVLSFIYGIQKLSRSLSVATRFEGVMLLGEQNEVIQIDRYEFSESAASHMRGLTAENKALGASWRKASLGVCFGGHRDPNKHQTELGHQLANEAIEYFVLNELSLHLSAYFDSYRNVSDDVVSRIKRRDIPRLLLDNHFLEQFSRPMSEREAFGHHEPDENIQVVAAWGENGEVFDQFELILPRGSTVARDAESLVIQTARYRLKVIPRFDGFSTNLPSDFEELYIGVPFDTYSPKQIGLDITIDFEWWSLLVPSGWDHYEWLDSFVERLEKSFCFDTFLRNVGWEAAHTVAVVTRSATKARADAA